MGERHRFPRSHRLALAAGTLALLAGPAAGDDNLVFRPLPPCRVVDTRVNGAGGPLQPGANRLILFHGPTRNYLTSPNQGGDPAGCGIPDVTSTGEGDRNIARAVMVNIVAVGPTGSGHLTAWPSNQPMPTASTLNFSPNQNIANGIVLPLCDQVAADPCASGDLLVRAAVAATHLVIDVLGYFHYGAAGTTRVDSLALGIDALAARGNFSVALGPYALRQSTGSSNTAVGSRAMEGNVAGSSNVAVGNSALGTASSNANTAVGARALNQSTGYGNTGVGWFAFNVLQTGDENIALGAGAGELLRDGSRNILIGNSGVGTESNTIRIGQSQSRTYIAGIHGSAVGNDARQVVVDENGRLGTSSIIVGSTAAVRHDTGVLERLQQLEARLLELESRLAACAAAPAP